MKLNWLIVCVMTVLCVVPFVANLLGENEFSSLKHPVSKILQTSAVQSKLPQGEKIIWSSNIDLKKAADGAVPVGIIGIAFIFVGICGVRSAPRHPIGLLWVAYCLPFALIGFYMLTGPYWTWRNNGNDVCLLTDKRALEIQQGIVTVDKRYSIQMIKPYMKKYSSDRSDVFFYEEVDDDSDSISFVRKGFSGIADGNGCLKILQSKIADSRKSR